MKAVIEPVSTLVDSSKLDEVLAYCIELSDESKTKFCIIQDILKLGKYLHYREMSDKVFYKLYDSSIGELEVIQFTMQAEYNTHTYRARVALNKSTQQQ